MRFATILSQGVELYSAVTDAGVMALSQDFPQWTTLKDVIAAQGFPALSTAADGMAVSHPNGSFSYEMPVANGEKIICVGVNFPDRNADYKDGTQAPANMSLFSRFARGFVGHAEALVRPPESHQLDYEGEIAIVIGKQWRRILQVDAYDHIAAITLCNEGTIRDWVRHAKFNFTQGKNLDNTGALVGPVYRCSPAG